MKTPCVGAPYSLPTSRRSFFVYPLSTRSARHTNVDAGIHVGLHHLLQCSGSYTEATCRIQSRGLGDEAENQVDQLCVTMPPTVPRYRPFCRIKVMLYVPDLPEVDVVRILRYFLLQAARLAKQSKDLPPLSITTDAEGDDGPPPAKRSKTDRKRLRNHAVRGDEAGDGDELRLSQKHISSSVNGGRVSVVENASVGRNIQKSGVVGEGEEENGGETMESKVKEKKMMDMPTSLSNVVLTTNEQHPKHGKLNDKLVIVDADGKSTAEVHRASNGTLPNGHAHGHDDGGGTSSESGGGVSEEEREEAAPVTGDHGEPTRQEGGKRVKGPKTPCGTKRSTGVVAPAAACAERGVRVALTLPHNEAFLRSALSVLSYQEVIVVLKVRPGTLCLVPLCSCFCCLCPCRGGLSLFFPLDSQL